MDAAGRIDQDELDTELGDDVLLVSIMAVNNEIGTIQDIPAIARKTSQFGCILHCDAAQAPFAIDMSGLARASRYDEPLRPQDLWAHGSRSTLC